MRYSLCPVVVLATAIAASLPAQIPAPSQAAVHHEANFDAERKQANDLYVAGKVMEALPLYEDLCRQDPTLAVFAERHASGLLEKQRTMPDGPAKNAVYTQGMAELRRAQSLGDNSPLVQNILSMGSKTILGAAITGVSLSVGYTYNGNAQAQAALKQAEAAFATHDFAAAAKLYQNAAALDPAWYSAPLFAGDMYFRMNDWNNAGIWFQKAIDIDPDRDTAYRYWGDSLYHSGNAAEAKVKYKQAVVAEPYSQPGWNALQQWARVTGGQVVKPLVTIPAFKEPNGTLEVDPALMTETGDGHASWLVYEKARVADGSGKARQFTFGVDANGQVSANNERDSLTEEMESLTAMLADVKQKLQVGTVTMERLEPSLKNLLQIEKDGLLESWVLLNGPNPGPHFDLQGYRKEHRDRMVAYIDRYMLRRLPSKQ